METFAPERQIRHQTHAAAQPCQRSEPKAKLWPGLKLPAFLAEHFGYNPFRYER